MTGERGEQSAQNQNRRKQGSPAAPRACTAARILHIRAPTAETPPRTPSEPDAQSAAARTLPEISREGRVGDPHPPPPPPNLTALCGGPHWKPPAPGAEPASSLLGRTISARERAAFSYWKLGGPADRAHRPRLRSQGRGWSSGPLARPVPARLQRGCDANGALGWGAAWHPRALTPPAAGAAHSRNPALTA
ncbi:unnamed protein product [Rangifer tarandus platyrhynchus]|uniref:Uncharacterized protein n=1 Tax=Rangifer tarandus platyrhynchus TaxID=3082113 RepID=A0ABN8YEG7_RANTA|nr:unnamed protein product [Rangifer tarandus platyrhynchus]